MTVEERERATQEDVSAHETRIHLDHAPELEHRILIATSEKVDDPEIHPRQHRKRIEIECTPCKGHRLRILSDARQKCGQPPISGLVVRVELDGTAQLAYRAFPIPFP